MQTILKKTMKVSERGMKAENNLIGKLLFEQSIHFK